MDIFSRITLGMRKKMNILFSFSFFLNRNESGDFDFCVSTGLGM